MTGAPRILYVLNGFNRGGAEIGLRTMLENGFARDCAIRIFAIHEGAPALRAEIEALVGRDNVTVVAPGPALTLAAMARALVALPRLIARWRPDAAVLSLRQANLVGRTALLAFPRTRCIAFEHIARLERGRLTPLYALLLKALSPRVDEVWADCRATLIGARRYYGRRPRLERVVPLFVATGGAPPEEAHAAAGPIRLAAAGRLIPRKRTDAVLRAVAHLRAAGVPASLTVFGDGPERPRLEALAGELDLAGAVTFAGFRADWSALAREHDLFLNLSEEEGFCIVVAEAMMVGLPVVATAVGGIPDYATGGVEIVVARSAEPAEVAAIVAGLAADGPRRARLGRAAAERIASTFGAEAARRTYQNLTTAFRTGRTRSALRPNARGTGIDDGKRAAPG